jgi:cell division protein FtsW (lipid II flippase)
MKTKAGLSLNLLRISIGIFFVLLGLFGILPMIEESVFSLLPEGWNIIPEIIFGCVELVCGVIILLSLFTFLPKKTKQISSLLILIFWCARVVISKIFFGVVINGAGIWFIPDFGQWLLVLSAQLVIAASLWIFYRTYDK